MEVLYHTHYPSPKCIPVRDIALYYYFLISNSPFFIMQSCFCLGLTIFSFYNFLSLSYITKMYCSWNDEHSVERVKLTD